MLPRFKSAKDYTPAQRQRVLNALGVTIFLPWALLAIVEFGLWSWLCYSVVRGVWPALDVNGWRFISAILFSTVPGIGIAVLLTSAAFHRWFLRYRTRRRGRRAALRNILSPTDRDASLRRKLWLRMCGVGKNDLRQVSFLWHEEDDVLIRKRVNRRAALRTQRASEWRLMWKGLAAELRRGIVVIPAFALWGAAMVALTRLITPLVLDKPVLAGACLVIYLAGGSFSLGAVGRLASNKSAPMNTPGDKTLLGESRHSPPDTNS